MGVLLDIFGSEGLATGFFGGQWWMVGLFLLLIFVTYLFGAGFSAEALALFIFAGVILVTIDNLFRIPSDWIIIIITFIVILIGFSLNKFLRG